MNLRKVVNIRSARKYPDRTEAESLANQTGGKVVGLRILDTEGMEVRHVYTIQFPHDRTLRHARLSGNVGRPCYLAEVLA